MKTEIKGFAYRDSDHSYTFDGKRMTGCTTILGVLNKPALVPWSAKMAVEYVKEHSASREGIYSVLEGVLEEAKTAYAKKRDEGAQKGTDTHTLVEEYIKDCIATNGGKPILTIKAAHSSIEPFVTWADKENITFIASEAQLYSKSLFIAGTADFIFEKEGKRYVGDIKTFKKIWDRTPFYQCAGYALMWEEMHLDHEEAAKGEIDGYVIFNLPKEREFKEEEDVAWSFDVEGDTRAFNACVEIYRQNANFATKTKWKK